MSPSQLPQAFDPDFYRQNCQEAAGLSDELALVHFKAVGIRQGFVGSPAAERGYLLSFLDKSAPILEIGPFHAPSVVGHNVYYMDVLTTEELANAVREAGYDPARAPKIHYVARNGDFGMVDKKFSAVFSGHCIEHQPDLIRHLQDVSGALNEEGRYYIACPDKRFCFDHFAPESGIADVLAAHHVKRTVHAIKSFIVQSVHRAHNDPERHWADDHGPQQYEAFGNPKAEIFGDIPDDDVYHDAHAWQFTPASFFEIMTFLYRVGFTDLAPERVYHTVKGSAEFTAVLRKAKNYDASGEVSFVGEDLDRKPRALVDSVEVSEELAQVKEELSKARSMLINANEALARSRGDLASVYGSRSWRLTKPLRLFSAALRPPAR